MTAIASAVDAAGGQLALAAKLHVHPSLISQWVTGRLDVAARHCLPIEEATDGKVTRYDLRPDIFGQPEKRKRA